MNSIFKYLSVALLLLLVGCSISYKLNGASIDYTKVKSITIADFPNQAAYVNPTLSSTFVEELKDRYQRQTRLKLVDNNGDLQLEGEITGYEITQSAVKENQLASQTKLTVTVRVRYTNQTNSDEDFEQSFSAYREFSSDQMFSSVEAELCAEIVKELSDGIYNATVANW